MASPPWACDETLATLAGRKLNEDDLESNIARWTTPWNGQELMEHLQAAGVPAGVVLDCSDLYKDPQLSHRAHYSYLEHEEMGTYATDRSEFTLSLTPGYHHSPSPLLGRHNEHVFKEMLGLSDGEYRQLSDEGVLQ